MVNDILVSLSVGSPVRATSCDLLRGNVDRGAGSPSLSQSGDVSSDVLGFVPAQ